MEDEYTQMDSQTLNDYNIQKESSARTYIAILAQAILDPGSFNSEQIQFRIVTPWIVKFVVRLIVTFIRVVMTRVMNRRGWIAKFAVKLIVTFTRVVMTEVMNRRRKRRRKKKKDFQR